MPPLQITITGTLEEVRNFVGNQNIFKGDALRESFFIINGARFRTINTDLSAFPSGVYVNLELEEIKELKI